jgi:beta-barrel assembly-enhancing protease
LNLLSIVDRMGRYAAVGERCAVGNSLTAAPPRPYNPGMGNFFYNLGRTVGPNLRKANWVLNSLTGSEADAIRAEHAVGRDLAQAFVQQVELDPDPAIRQRIDSIGQRLAGCLKERQHRFWFGVVHSTEINAYALPGGFIFAMRALLESCQWDPDEIAFLLGHEMAHVVKRHAIDRLMANSIISGGLGRLPVGGPLRAPFIQLAASLLSQGYSQDCELEADRLGAKLARAAGFDPAGAVRLLNRLRSLPSEALLLSSYLSSHPPVDARIRAVTR